MAPITCGNCNEKLPRNGDFAVCSVCGNGLHLDKCTVKTQVWKSLGKDEKAHWACGDCLNEKGSSSKRGDNKNEDYEVSSIGLQKSILTKVNSLLDMKSKLDSIEVSMKFLADKYDDLHKEVTSLRTENQDLKKQLDSLQKKEATTSEQVDMLTVELADLDQYGRRMNLEIHGLNVQVPEDQQQEDLGAVLERLAKDIGVEHLPQYVHQAHRLQPRKDGKPPTVLVQFYSKTVRDAWINKGRNAKIRGLYFNENLCRYYRGLLRDTKAKARIHNFAFVWFKGGRILVKRREDDKNILAIKSYNDLNKIK